jgi:hypothetical protein
VYFNANIGDNHKVLVEAQLEKSYNKSDGEDLWVREEAIMNSIRIAAEIGSSAAKFLDEGFKGGASSAEICFGIKMTSDGAVAISMNPDGGQFRITVKQRQAIVQASQTGQTGQTDSAPGPYRFQEDGGVESEGDHLADELMNRIGKNIFGDGD